MGWGGVGWGGCGVEWGGVEWVGVGLWVAVLGWVLGVLCVHASMCVCVRERERTGMRASVCACERACMRACV